MTQPHGLTVKQHRFATEWLKTITEDRPEGNVTQAALAAGYGEKSAHQTGYELKNHPKVIAYVEALKQGAYEDAGLTEQWVVQRLMLEAEDMDNSGSERIRAVELLGKKLGMFVERKEVRNIHEASFFASLDMDEGQPALPRPDADYAEFTEVEGCDEPIEPA